MKLVVSLSATGQLLFFEEGRMHRETPRVHALKSISLGPIRHGFHNEKGPPLVQDGPLGTL